MYSEIEKQISNCVENCRLNKLNHDKVFIGNNEKLVFFNSKTNKYLCFNHYFEYTLIEYLLNCGNPLYILNCEKIYLFSDKYIKEILMKNENESIL